MTHTGEELAGDNNRSQELARHIADMMVLDDIGVSPVMHTSGRTELDVRGIRLPLRQPGSEYFDTELQAPQS